MKTMQYLLWGMLLLCVGGCWGQSDIENVGNVPQLGIELAPNGRILLTAATPLFGPTRVLKNTLASSETDLLRHARESLQRESAVFLRSAKLEQVLFSASMARQGLFPWLDILTRDPLDPPLATLVVVDGSPKTLMEKAQQFKNQPISPFYIRNLLAINQGNYVPANSISSFVILYYAPGLDPVAPIIKLGANKILIIGTALFSDDRMVGRITPEQTELLLAMQGKLRPVEYIFHHINTIPGAKSTKPNAAGRILSVKRQIKIRMHQGHPEITYQLKFTGVLDEFHWDRLDDPQSRQKLERHFAQELARECTRLTRQMQQAGSDPLGSGDLVRANFPDYWKRHHPKRVYPATRIRVNTQFKIIRFGTIK